MVWEQLPRGFSHPFALVLLQMESWLSGEEASFSKENGNIQIFFFLPVADSAKVQLPSQS